MELIDGLPGSHTHARALHAVALGHGLAACECQSATQRRPARHVRVGKGMVGRVYFFNARLAPRSYRGGGAFPVLYLL
jgi:hypothetical protein